MFNKRDFIRAKMLQDKNLVHIVPKNQNNGLNFEQNKLIKQKTEPSELH